MHRQLVNTACKLAAKLGGPDIGAAGIQVLSAILSRLGAIPVDESKVSYDPDVGEDRADQFLAIQEWRASDYWRKSDCITGRPCLASDTCIARNLTFLLQKLCSTIAGSRQMSCVLTPGSRCLIVLIICFTVYRLRYVLSFPMS